MNLQTTLALLQAGGPGSGPRPGFGHRLNNLPGTLIDKYRRLDQQSTVMMQRLTDKLVKNYEFDPISKTWVVTPLRQYDPASKSMVPTEAGRRIARERGMID